MCSLWVLPRHARARLARKRIFFRGGGSAFEIPRPDFFPFFLGTFCATCRPHVRTSPRPPFRSAPVPRSPVIRPPSPAPRPPTERATECLVSSRTLHKTARCRETSLSPCAKILRPKQITGNRDPRTTNKRKSRIVIAINEK